MLLHQDAPIFGEVPLSSDDELVEQWRSAVYPYRNLMARKTYEAQKYLMRFVLHTLPYAGKDVVRIGPLDPLLVGRPADIYELAERPR
jgi:hypothetical protein